MTDIPGGSIEPGGGGGGGETTERVALPATVSLVAMICAEPTATAVTNPELLTVATDVLLDVQAIARPVRTLLLASRVVAVACVVDPGLSEVELSETLTDATAAGGGGGGAATLTPALPLFPSLVAVICAVPAATAVTTPEPLTVATPLLLDVQAMARPVSTLLLASRVVAVACVV
jgi:hypothetical protein